MHISACWASWEGRAGHGPEAEGRDDPALKREVACWLGVVEGGRGGEDDKEKKIIEKKNKKKLKMKKKWSRSEVRLKM
jgi:hypothetical protein